MAGGLVVLSLGLPLVILGVLLQSWRKDTSSARISLGDWLWLVR